MVLPAHVDYAWFCMQPILLYCNCEYNAAANQHMGTDGTIAHLSTLLSFMICLTTLHWPKETDKAEKKI